MTTTRVLENGNLSVHVDLAVRRMANRRRIVYESADPGPAAHEILARIGQAREWMQALEEGAWSSVVELARHLGMDRSNLVRDLALAWLSPKVVRAVIRGETDVSLCGLRAVAGLDWASQEAKLGIA